MGRYTHKITTVTLAHAPRLNECQLFLQPEVGYVSSSENDSILSNSPSTTIIKLILSKIHPTKR